MEEAQLRDFPPVADVETDIFRPLPVVNDIPAEASSDGAEAICIGILSAFSEVLEGSDSTRLEDLFLGDGAYWRDTLAFTYHLRTFAGRGAIAGAFRELHPQRRGSALEITPCTAKPVSAGPSLGWVECSFTFKTEEPKATCAGNMMLIPEPRDGGPADWKIWVLSTWLVGFDEFQPDEARLRAHSNIPCLSEQYTFETDVVIVGAGNSGLVLASRLKALGVTYVLIEKNKKVGDNWARRYDNLRFHTGNGFCETPYLPYPNHVPVGLHRDDLAEQMRRFAGAFHLNDDVLHSTTVQSTSFDSVRKVWSVTVGPSEKTIACKHLVLCTGIASSAPYVPDIPGRELYEGISIHSNDFRSGKCIAAKSVKSVAAVGSANTGFDVMEDCYNAGLETTMIERSPTYIIPMSYLLHPNGFGIFDHEPLDVADPAMFTAPLAVGGQLLGMLHASLASQEPDRYAHLAASGFQVLDSMQANLAVCLTKRNGGHFVDIGTGIELLSSRKVGIRAGVSPVAFTSRGLKLSDGSTLDTEAIVWCTGHRDTDVRNVVTDILGEGGVEIRDRMDATWNVDAEGEMRGVWKRHAEVENFFVMGGGTGYQRWYSKVVALQIKAALEGILPEAYRNDFGIAVICAITLEVDVVDALLERCLDDDGPPCDKAPGDPNAYSTGTIGRYNVVLAHMPGIGKANAAAVAANCRKIFYNIKLAIIVALCGAIPFDSDGGDIVLGDVIVSDGVIQYHLGIRLPERFMRKEKLLDFLGRPNAEIRGLLAIAMPMKVMVTTTRQPKEIGGTHL